MERLMSLKIGLEQLSLRNSPSEFQAMILWVSKEEQAVMVRAKGEIAG